MSQPRVVSERRNHEKMAEMVKLIAERGPHIDEISRVMGVYNETVRYWFRQLVDRGFTIQASCDYGRLGMQRVIVVVKLGQLFDECADTVLSALGELSYVIGYAKVATSPFYILGASIPQEGLDSWIDFMVELKKMGVFESVESVALDWVRNVPMRAEHFDFETGKWRFDWRRRKNMCAPEVIPSPREEYDSTDLKIIEQLQLNANVSLTEMCQKVGVRRYKAFSYHYRQHVLGRHLVRGYRVNWTGMRYGPEELEAKKSGEVGYRYAWVDVIATDLTMEECSQVRKTLGQTPYVWIEGASARTYYARLVFPKEQVPEFIQTLDHALEHITNRLRWFQLDQTHALSFSLPNQLYSERDHRWTFKKEEAVQRFEALKNVRYEVVHGHHPTGRRKQ